MKQEVRVWWEELADQYEEWAEKPPHCIYGEEYTCVALAVNDWGFTYEAVPFMRRIWRSKYGDIDFPVGHIDNPDRAELRFDFCWYMAERIREYLGEE